MDVFSNLKKYIKGVRKTMVINHSLSSMFASRLENINANNLQKSMEKLSSGERINRAGDDAANLAVSEKMRSQIRGLNQASKNVENGVSFIQTAEGYLQETTNILQRIRELSVQASNGIYTAEDRAQLQVEVSQLVSELDRISSQSQFNGLNLLSGRFATEPISFQIGANMDQKIEAYISTMTAQALGLKGMQGDSDFVISVEDSDMANITIGAVDEALKRVNRQRADLGAYQNRMEMAKKGVDVAAENLTAAESKIRDTDYATEMVNFTKNQILQQVSTAMLSQANLQAENVLSLLKN